MRQINPDNNLEILGINTKLMNNQNNIKVEKYMRKLYLKLSILNKM